MIPKTLGVSSPTDASVVRNFRMNFDLVLQRIRELNVLAGEGECFVQSTATGAQLAKKEPIQLSLHSNGIVMFDGPFRSYQEQSTQVSFAKLLRGKCGTLKRILWWLKSSFDPLHSSACKI